MIRSVTRSTLLTGRWYESMLAGVIPRFGVAGYFMSGFTGATSNTVDKFAFASDTRTTLTTSQSARGPSGFANSGVAGYCAGGVSADGNTFYTTVDKFAFPADTRTTLGTGLSAGRFAGAGFSNPSVAGYFAGGRSAATLFLSTVEKFAFPADSRTTLATGLSAGRITVGAMSDYSVAGYVAGGRISGNTNVTTVDKFAFPADTRTTLGTGVSDDKEGTAGFCNTGVAGYIAGGIRITGGGAVFSTVDKFAFPADTRTTLATGLSAGTNRPAGVSNSAVAGYVGGGDNNFGTFYTTVDKFAFPSDTRSTLGTGLSVARSESAGMSNEGVF